MIFQEKIAAALLVAVLFLAGLAGHVIHLPTVDNPTVTAAIVTALVAIVTLIGNAIMNSKQHREKLRADISLAERRFAYDRELSTLKVNNERMLAMATRRAEFAEAALEDFYKARALIAEIREPGNLGFENHDRPGRDTESDDLRAWRDRYYPTVRRINATRDFFNGFYARRYRSRALFGVVGEEPFTAIWNALNRVNLAAHQLSASSPDPFGQLRTPGMARYEAWIWSTGDQDDPIAPTIEAAVEQAERVLGSALIATQSEV